MKMIQHILRLLLAVYGLLLIGQPLLAAEKPVGSVVALRGEVTAENTVGGSRRLAVKAEIYLADTVKTGGRGRVQMMFDDNTLISLGPNTHMQIIDYQWNSAQKSGKMKTRVSEGVFRIMGGAITQVAPRNFKTDTPAGTIGIRGSMYAGKVEGSSLRLLFQGGKGIYVTNDAGTVNIDRPGFGTFVAGPRTPPTPSARLDREEMAQMDEVTADAPADSQDNDGTEPGTESQTPTDTTGEPGAGEDEQVVEDQEVLEAFDEPTADPEAPFLTEANAADPLQSNVIANPVDSVKDVATTAVTDSIEDVRQEKVLEIEQAIMDLLVELGFTGDHSSSIPNDGIEGFDGVVRHKSIDNETYSESPAKMVINWHNKKFFGIVDDNNKTDPHLPVFIFGDVHETALANLTAIGSGLMPDQTRVSTIQGTGTFGQIYGTETDATGFAMQGVEVDVAIQSDRKAWTAYGAMISNGEPSAADSPPGGTHILKGFVMGIAEDMSAPQVNRRIFMNDQAGEFRLSIDKDTGTVSGKLSANDFNGSDSAITFLQIGEPLASAYVLDDAMIALLGGADCMTSGSNTGSLKEFGNYLVTEKEPDQLAPYTTWGYWEIAYRDPESGTDYHVHHPIAYWIAGPQTPAAEISSLMGSNFMGTYTGGAEGIQINTTGMISGLTGGTSNFTIDFNPSATMPVMGNISFDQVNLNVQNGAVTTSGFSGQIGAAISSKVKGGFFGPNAAAIGGNFGAKMSTGEEYYGIFAGSR
jgi:hypothetical protein